MGPARGKIALARLFLLLAWLALAALPAVAARAHESPQRSETSPQSNASPRSEAGPQSYEGLLERIKRGDSTVDFGALRHAFAASPAQRPCNAEAKSLRAAMLSAYAAEDYATALDRAVTWGAEAMAGDAAFSLRRPRRREARSS